VYGIFFWVFSPYPTLAVCGGCLAGFIECLTCRQETPWDADRSYQQLRVNMHLLGLMERLLEEEQEEIERKVDTVAALLQRTVLCGSCSKVPATVFCMDCPEHVFQEYCDTCVAEEHASKVQRPHILVCVWRS
jgi:hypothetical protein